MVDKDILRVYDNSSSSGRVDLICKHYSTFLGLIESFTEGIVYMIEDAIDLSVRRENGDLGVRIQVGDGCGNPTLRKAFSNITIRDDVMKCDFSDGLLEEIEDGELFVKTAFVLKRMRRDYKLLKSQIDRLPEQDKQLFLEFMQKNKSIKEISSEFQMQLETAHQKVRRIKNDMKRTITIYTEGEIKDLWK